MTDRHIEIEGNMSALRCVVRDLQTDPKELTREQRGELSELMLDISRIISKGCER